MAARPKRARSVNYEGHLADRIRDLRETRGWSLDNLAQRMTEAGCPMDRSAIHRIEQGRPRRRITVDEFVTFAHVFGVSRDAMLVPAAVARSREAARAWKRYLELEAKYRPLQEQLNAQLRTLVTLVGDGHSAEVLQALQEQVGADGTVAGWHGSPEDFVSLLDHLSDGGARDVEAEDLR